MTPMQPVTYDTIEPNIAEIDAQGDQVYVSWKCPSTGAIVGKTRGVMVPDAMTTGVQKAVVRTAIGQILNKIVAAIGQTMGGFSGQVASAAVAPAAAGLISKASATRYTEGMRRKAVIQAFDGIKSKFHWDEDRGQFVASPGAE
jgi:hypothetical protein